MPITPPNPGAPPKQPKLEQQNDDFTAEGSPPPGKVATDAPVSTEDIPVSEADDPADKAAPPRGAPDKTGGTSHKDRSKA